MKELKGTMSKKKRKAIAKDDIGDWMTQLDTIVTNSKKPGGNDHLFRLSSFPAELLRDGYSVKWKPFSFKIDEVGPKESRSMTIVEYGVDDAKPVDVRIGTQPMALVESMNLADVVLYCKGYSVTDFQGRPHLFIWEMETAEMIDQEQCKRRRWERQVTLPIIKLKRKKRKSS